MRYLFTAVDMSMPSHETALTWVPGKNAPGNTLRRHRNISGEALRQDDLFFIKDFTGKHVKFSRILIRLFMETNGMDDSIFEKSPGGCARVWENVISHIRRNAIICFDICTCTLRSDATLLALAKELYHRPTLFPSNHSKNVSDDCIRRYMFSKRYVSSLISQDLEKFHSQLQTSTNETRQPAFLPVSSKNSRKRQHPTTDTDSPTARKNASTTRATSLKHEDD